MFDWLIVVALHYKIESKLNDLDMPNLLWHADWPQLIQIVRDAPSYLLDLGGLVVPLSIECLIDNRASSFFAPTP